MHGYNIVKNSSGSRESDNKFAAQEMAQWKCVAARAHNSLLLAPESERLCAVDAWLSVRVGVGMGEHSPH